MLCPPACAGGPTPPLTTSRAAPHDEAAALEALRSRLGPGFRIDGTDHFAIVTDTPTAVAQSLGATAEHALRSVQSFMRELNLPSAAALQKKMILVVFDRWSDYADCCAALGLRPDENTPGLFDRRSNRCVMFNFANASVVRARRADIDAGRARLRLNPDPNEATQLDRLESELARLERIVNDTVVRHEIAHLVLANLLPDTGDRPWLSEGLATQFESDAKINRYRAADLKTQLNRQGGGVDLRRLVSDRSVMAPGGGDAPAAYATAWGLVRYLADRRPAALARYLSAPAVTGDAAHEIRSFEAAFGPLDSSFTAKWQAYVRELARPE